MMPEFKRWFDCCVDLDHLALNTIGNAVETQALGARAAAPVADRRDLEFPHAARDGRNRAPASRRGAGAYPVVSDRVRIETWWANPATARLLFLEYLKYMVALARMRLHAFA